MSTFRRASTVLMNQSGNLYEKNYSLVLKINPRLNKNLQLLQLNRNNTTAGGDKGAKAAKPEPKGTSYKNLTIGVLRESFQNEKRVAVTPAVTQTLTKKGFKVVVEENAGNLAKFPNEDYEKAGAKITNAGGVFSSSDILLKVRAPSISVIILCFYFRLSN